MDPASAPESEPAGHAGGARSTARERGGPVGRDYEKLWFTLARWHWRLLVVVPADEGGSAAGVAASLTEVGRKLRESPVTFLIMAHPLDFAAAGKIIGAFELTRQGGNALAVVPSGKVIVAIQPVVKEPLGLAVTEAADAVVLCIERGRTRLAAARRTIDLIGRQRIAGSLFIT